MVYVEANLQGPTMETQSRRRWRCPGCGKLFSIPANKADPDICPKCLDSEYEEATEVVESQSGGRTSAIVSTFAPTVKFLAVVFSGVVGVLLVLALIGKLTDDVSDLDDKDIANQSLPRFEPSPLPENDPEVSRPQQQRPVQKQWVKVGEWSGTGVKTTERFTSQNGDMRVTWAAQAGEFGGGLSIEVKGEGRFDSHLAANEVIQTGKRSDVSHVYGKPGRYYLDISGTLTEWSVIVEDLQ